jgi:ABC-type uncharacterized transport system substrate-binding protein
VVGLLSTQSAESEIVVGPFKQGLKETGGFIEGRNVVIEYRWAENQIDRLPALAADLVRQRVSVIAAFGDAAALASKTATTTIPIAFVVGSDPVSLGLVASLNRPGRNVTGFASLRTLLASKQLQLVRELGQLAAFAMRHALPTIYQYREYAVAGGLMSYGGSLGDVFRQVGVYVGRILKGANPADLPVEQGTKIELTLNLKTAKALGLEMPAGLLVCADTVIE